MNTLSLRKTVLIAVLSLVVSGCNTSAIYMDDAYNPPVYWGSHYVRGGENIGTIAWRYGRDYRELASANEIRPPYTLKIGQRIRLDLAGDPNAYADYDGAVSDVTTRSSGSERAGSEGDAFASKPDNLERSVGVGTKFSSGLDWQWPAKGEILTQFTLGRISNKGLDISGEEGDPVFAAADGRVVYAGGGVVGYGNLVIIDHGPGLLSAYAHNKSIYVRIGDRVRRGDAISAMGRVGTSDVRLHFEIRKGGKPVDPLSYLPAKA